MVPVQSRLSAKKLIVFWESLSHGVKESDVWDALSPLCLMNLLLRIAIHLLPNQIFFKKMYFLKKIIQIAVDTFKIWPIIRLNFEKW